MNDLIGYRLEYSTESGDGFGVKVFVRRPERIEALLEDLDDTPPPDFGLTPKEKEQSALSSKCEAIYKELHLQAARVDPKLTIRESERRQEFEDAFKAAELAPIFVEAIPNEYWGADSPFGVKAPWYMITTRLGHFKVGWRKRVIVIDWSRTTLEVDGRVLFGNEGVTKEDNMIHAWSLEKVTEYLKRLADTTEDLEKESKS